MEKYIKFKLILSNKISMLIKENNKFSVLEIKPYKPKQNNIVVKIKNIVGDTLTK